MNNTLDFYDKNAKELIKKYDKANLEQLHSIFRKYVNKKDNVLDIGFGSGRDLKFIQSITHNVFGLDSCDAFIHNMQNNGLDGRVAKCILPNIRIDKFKIKIDKFDIITSIAVLMHLNISEINQTIINIKKILVDNSMFIISYSLKRQVIDDRYFEFLTKDIMTDIFKKNNFYEIESFQNFDVMNRNIQWITQVFKLKRL